MPNILFPKGFIQIYNPAHHSWSRKWTNLLLCIKSGSAEQDPETACSFWLALDAGTAKCRKFKTLNWVACITSSSYSPIRWLAQWNGNHSFPFGIGSAGSVFQEIKCRFVEMCRPSRSCSPQRRLHRKRANFLFGNNISQNIKLRILRHSASFQLSGKTVFPLEHTWQISSSPKISANTSPDSGNWPLVGEIAQQVGLNDQQHFRSSSRKTGYTPERARPAAWETMR